MQNTSYFIKLYFVYFDNFKKKKKKMYYPFFFPIKKRIKRRIIHHILLNFLIYCISYYEFIGHNSQLIKFIGEGAITCSRNMMTFSTNCPLQFYKLMVTMICLDAHSTQCLTSTFLIQRLAYLSLSYLAV